MNSWIRAFVVAIAFFVFAAGLLTGIDSAMSAENVLHQLYGALGACSAMLALTVMLLCAIWSTLERRP